MEEDVVDTALIMEEVSDHRARPRRRPPRIAVAAVPNLLADALRSLLADADSDVTLLTEDTTERFDVALVTSGGPSVEAELAIVLDNGAGGTGVATVCGPDGRPLVLLDGLPAILDFVHRWCHGARPQARDQG